MPAPVSLLALIALVALLSACGPDEAARAAAMTGGGDAERGRVLLRVYGCGGCHVVPGVPAADGTVGPSLAGIASRTILAGELPNTPANLVRWIRRPQEIEPGNAMPDLGVSERDGRDLAAYLYTLR
jgi:cytochrome c2